MVGIDTDSLIPFFAQSHTAAQKALERGDKQGALRGYQQLLDIYRQMESAGVEGIHRELAHDQLTRLYDVLSGRQQQPAPAVQPAPVVSQTSFNTQTPLYTSAPSQIAPASPSTPVYAPSVETLQQRTTAPATFGGFSSKEILLIGVFVAMIGFVLFAKPEYLGLAAADIGSGATIPVDTVYTSNGHMELVLGSVPTSIRLTGLVKGSGTARVYLVKPEGRVTVFDSSLVSLPGGEVRAFDDSCLGSCVLEGVSRNVLLEIEVQNAELTIKTLRYTAKTNNAAPRYKGPEGITIAAGVPTTIDLSQFFEDADGDTLGYLASNAPGVTASVNGGSVTFDAIAGEHVVTLIASDGEQIARQPFNLHVR